MKNYSFINLFVVMVFSLLLGACDHDDDYVSYSIDLKDTPDQYEYLDEMVNWRYLCMSPLRPA